MRYTICNCLLGVLSVSLFYAANAGAASIGFDVRQVCKGVHAIRDDQFGAGIVAAYCFVDIRHDNIRETIRERILAGEAGPALLPVFRGSASSLLVLRPALPMDGPVPGDDAFTLELQQQLAQPFQSLSDAIASFTGPPGVALDLGATPPWLSLPALSEERSLVFHTTFQAQTLNASPVVVPLPPAAGLLAAGLLMLGGSRMLRRSPAHPAAHP
jgi:hypothetical protein